MLCMLLVTMNASSPQSSLPSSPASSFSSLPSSLFSSLPASPPSHHSPLPLVLPSVLVQHDISTNYSYIILGSESSSKPDLLDFLGIQALNVDFDQSDDVYDVLTPIYEAILDRFQQCMPSILPTYPHDWTQRDFVSLSRTHLFTAAILVLSSLKLTPLERRLVSALSPHIPVIPVISNYRIKRIRIRNSNRSHPHPQPLTPLQLRTILSHSPQATHRIQQEAVHRFLSWHTSRSVDSEKHNEHRHVFRPHLHPYLILDPLHLPSIVSLSVSVCKSIVSSMNIPPRVFVITILGAFCAGLGVGCYFNSKWFC